MPESTVAGDDATTIAVVGTGAITVGILDMIDELLRLYGERIVFFETHQFDETQFTNVIVCAEEACGFNQQTLACFE